MDIDLRILGKQFYIKIKERHWLDSQRILMYIEMRSNQLIAELTAKQQTNETP